MPFLIATVTTSSISRLMPSGAHSASAPRAGSDYPSSGSLREGRACGGEQAACPSCLCVRFAELDHALTQAPAYGWQDRCAARRRRVIVGPQMAVARGERRQHPRIGLVFQTSPAKNPCAAVRQGWTDVALAPPRPPAPHSRMVPVTLPAGRQAARLAGRRPAREVLARHHAGRQFQCGGRGLAEIRRRRSSGYTQQIRNLKFGGRGHCK